MALAFERYSKMSDPSQNKMQKGIDDFFKVASKKKTIPPIPPQNIGGVLVFKCRYCRKTLTAQGYQGHENSCTYRKDNPEPHVKPSYGKVKVVGEAPSDQPSQIIAPPAAAAAAAQVAASANSVQLNTDSSESDGSDFDSDSEGSLKPAASTTKLSLQQKIELIQHYEQSSKPSYSATAKWGKSQFNRQTLSHVAVSRIIGNKDKIMADKTSRSRRKKLSVGKGKRSGQYPGMEKELAERITTAREQGIPYETWMLAYDAKDILRKKNHKASTRFKASPSWQRTFLERAGLSIRKVTNASTALSGPNRRNTERTVVDYLRRARAFQMEEINDPVWGVTSPYGVFNRDEVPIALCPSNAQTVDEKGTKAVIDSLRKSQDMKRFATLDLTIVMKPHPSGKNVPKPHIIFRAKHTQSGTSWNVAEQQEWDPDVVVSFHPNAYVDWESNLLGLQHVMKPINDYLEEINVKGVYYEDNFSAHKKEIVVDYWKSDLKQFKQPQYYPPDLTMSLQPVDAHIGIRYKKAVYKTVRDEIFKRRKTENMNQLTARERRILITKAVGSVHRAYLQHTKSVVDEGRDDMQIPTYRAFIQTGNYLPIQHLREDHTGTPDIDLDSAVKIQHFEKLTYPDLVNKVCVSEWIKERDEERKAEALEAEATKEKLRTLQWNLDSLTAKYRDQGIAFKNQKRDEFIKLLEPTILAIANKMRGNFCVMGSWPAKIAMQLINPNLEKKMKANDIDVYYPVGSNSSQKGDELKIDFTKLEYIALDGQEVNKIPVLQGYSVEELLLNNDINATAIGLDISVILGGEADTDKVDSDDILIAPHYGKHFWEFAYSDSHSLKPTKANAGAKTFVRLQYKSCQMELPVSGTEHMDVFSEILSKSHKEKFDFILNTKPEQVKGVRIKPFRGPTTFKLEEVSTPSICSVCKVKQGNTKCEYKACKKCCVESYGGCVVHKPKEEEGKPAAKKQRREEVEEEQEEELESIAPSSEEEN